MATQQTAQDTLCATTAGTAVVVLRVPRYVVLKFRNLVVPEVHVPVPLSVYCTYGWCKSNFLEIYYFHIITAPLERKFHADSRNGFEKFHIILEGYKIFDCIFGEIAIQILKIV